MPNPLNLSIEDYPCLGRLIPGQEVKLELKVSVGTKTLTGQGEYITLIPLEIEVEEEQKPSVQEVLLASINEHLGKQSIQTP